VARQNIECDIQHEYDHLTSYDIKWLPGLPWEEVDVDLIGPWKITVPDGVVQFFALTMIDTTTTISEIVRIENKTSQHVAMQFENSWVACYPIPV
jgi:hypothetical protein